MASPSLTQPQQSVPFWRDVRYISILLQIIFVIVVVITFVYLYGNMMEGLRRANLLPSLAFLNREAGIPIGEGIPYSPSDSYRYAFIVGIVNTLRVAVIGIILATIVGLIIGISRLSTNWLLRNITYAIVEVVRNIPVLVQLFFWYTLTRTFPAVQEAINVFGLARLTNRGVALAWPRGTETWASWAPWLIGALVVGIGVFAWRKWDLARRDQIGFVLPWALLASLVVAIASYFVVTAFAGAAPVRLDVPVQERFNFVGGVNLTSSFFALLVGLVVYTGVFIGEIVRGGILAVSHGQREAARALGLNEGQTLRLVVLPQALRIIIPPTTNQYLNLAKNSSLAIAIGYPDLFSIGFTMSNQTGQVVPIVLMVMGSYLTLSLLTSLIMNLYNQRVQLVER
jgi:general L-amino acid transport system permease protein